MYQYIFEKDIHGTLPDVAGVVKIDDLEEPSKIKKIVTNNTFK